MERKNRVEYIDFVKGIAILLVIIGHTGGGIIRGFIFSFHMPLFFLLSSVTYKFSQNNNEFRIKTQKAFRHLIIPAILIFLIRTIIYLINNLELLYDIRSLFSFVTRKSLALFFSSGVPFDFYGNQIEALGIPWFLVVLFLGRSLFDFLHMKLSNKYLIISCIVLAVIGVGIGQVLYLPFSIDIAFAIMPLFLCGLYFRFFRVENNCLIKFLLFLVLWMLTFSVIYFGNNDYLELACRRYTLFPFCWVIALLGILAMVEFGVLVDNINIFKPIKYLGQNSLYMLCVHMMDYVYFDRILLLNISGYITAIIRVVIDVCIFFILMFVVEKIKGVKSLDRGV